jgi:hypothetical protein
MGRTIGAPFARWYPLFGDTFELFPSSGGTEDRGRVVEVSEGDPPPVRT